MSTGFGFPFTATTPHADESESVRAALVQLLGTRRGERLYRPDYGVKVLDFLFEANDETLEELIRADMLAAVGAWEPRVLIVDVQFERRDVEFDVTLVYVLRSAAVSEPPSVTMTYPTGGL